MKLLTIFLCLHATAAFVPKFQAQQNAKALRNVADDLGIPCEDECAIGKFPNLPESVHPGVLSGQAMMDLLSHAKENGE